VGAAVAAESVAQNAAGEARQAFDQSSAEIASRLQTTIHDEESLVVNAGAFVLEHPDATYPELQQWMTTVQAFERYPELEALAHLVIVPASDLDAYVTAKNLSAGVDEPGAGFEVTPPGKRPFYCLVAVGDLRDLTSVPPAGLDYCAAPDVAASIVRARDTGQSSYEPIVDANGLTRLGAQVPIYLGGAVPTTQAARRAGFVGVLGMTLDQTAVLERALTDHRGLAVTMHYDGATTDVAFSAGQVPEGAQASTISLNNGWTVKTFGTVASGDILSNDDATALLVTGVMVSILLGLLVLVLGTGQQRALRLVGEKTGELRHQASHDALTGLPNRALIMDRIEQLLARNRRNKTEGAVLFIDLDEFKKVNDTLGHEAGDQLLMAVSARLRSTLRDADTIGRMGGDEFVVLLDGGRLEVAPELVASRVLDVMRQPFELTGVTMPLIVNTSIGIALGDRATAGELLRDADVALYEAKDAGRDRYEFFHPGMQTGILQRIELEFDLRSALDEGQFHLVYQPIYDLEDLTLIGVEALLRWDHPSRGLTQPDEFIPILEHTGQINDVGRWALHQACEQMAAWHAAGNILDISVNVSGRQLDKDDILGHIRDALATSGLDPTSLIIEVTETALMRNAEATAGRLRAIKDLGVRVAVDDFGTGYSSLAYLQQFPVDCLKIDRMFTSAIATSPESKALIGTLVQLGKDLGLKTLAEGVETVEEMDLLRGQHVNEAQGFLLSRPLDPHTLEAQLLAPARPPTPTSDVTD